MTPTHTHTPLCMYATQKVEHHFRNASSVSGKGLAGQSSPTLANEVVFSWLPRVVLKSRSMLEPKCHARVHFVPMSWGASNGFEGWVRGPRSPVNKTSVTGHWSQHLNTWTVPSYLGRDYYITLYHEYTSTHNRTESRDSVPKHAAVIHSICKAAVEVLHRSLPFFTSTMPPMCPPGHLRKHPRPVPVAVSVTGIRCPKAIRWLVAKLRARSFSSCSSSSGSRLTDKPRTENKKERRVFGLEAKPRDRQHLDGSLLKQTE